MTPSDYCYWLHGWAEINGGKPPTATQWQIINDHLDIVFNKVTPDRQLQSVESSSTFEFPYTGHPPITGVAPWDGTAPITITGTKGIVTLTGIVDFAAYEAAQNRDKIFITVSRVPIYDPKSTYSFYQYNPVNWQKPEYADPMIRGLLTGVGIQPVSDKVYLVVDNTLNPTKPTYADEMRGSSNHLTMLSRTGPGIINVGVGSPLIC